MADIRLLQIPSDGAVTYKIPGEVPLRAEGIVSLAQAVVNNLLTTPGSDALSPNRGAGLGDLTRRYRTNSSDLREEIKSRVDELAVEMKNEQQELDLPPDETLASMSVSGVNRNSDDPSQLDIFITVRSAAGQNAEIQV
ncbi:hypothetical protein [Salinibacter ruber]|jgi:hypothetical protein|uniref:Uncharacterized protein n=1 Tax=Salinibacter ruber TaxID=146919 RepID=A0AAW5P863_9BACT|nr:hypothetical protein [Salinibacter ruber]MCS4157644.1 hypothetical protein [Salinibacter ruber]